MHINYRMCEKHFNVSKLLLEQYIFPHESCVLLYVKFDIAIVCITDVTQQSGVKHSRPDWSSSLRRHSRIQLCVWVCARVSMCVSASFSIFYNYAFHVLYLSLSFSIHFQVFLWKTGVLLVHCVHSRRMCEDDELGGLDRWGRSTCWQQTCHLHHYRNSNVLILVNQ